MDLLDTPYMYPLINIPNKLWKTFFKYYTYKDQINKISLNKTLKVDTWKLATINLNDK